MGLSITIRTTVWLVILVTETVWAKALPEHMPEQIVSAIEHFPADKLGFSTEESDGVATAYLHVCKNRAGNYGLVPFNSSSPACWVFESKKRVIEADVQYVSVFRSNEDIDRNIGVFLESQPDANKGSWTRKSEHLCYTPNEGGQTKHYCLRSSGTQESSPTSDAPTTPAIKSGSNDGYFYGAVAVILVVIGVVAGYAECKMRCMTTCCNAYWNEW